MRLVRLSGDAWRSERTISCALLSAAGSAIGLGYGLATGFIGGWLFAFLRNALMFLYLTQAYRKAQRGLLRRFFDYT